MVRLFNQGEASLSDSELLSILLRTGDAQHSATERARQVLSRAGGLHALLGGADCLVHAGLTYEQIARIRVSLELARRTLHEQLRGNNSLTSPGAVRDYLRLAIAAKEHEVFVCVWLDAQHRVIRIEEAFRGTLTQTAVYPREIVKHALAVNAAAVIFAHNHPSSVAQPSQADEPLTRNLKDALSLVGVKVLDHFIIAGDQALSFSERGLL